MKKYFAGWCFLSLQTEAEKEEFLERANKKKK
jgi:hypothetical protein